MLLGGKMVDKEVKTAKESGNRYTLGVIDLPQFEKPQSFYLPNDVAVDVGDDVLVDVNLQGKILGKGTVG